MYDNQLQFSVLDDTKQQCVNQFKKAPEINGRAIIEKYKHNVGNSIDGFVVPINNVNS